MQAQPICAGLMVPANNTTMQPELLAWLPEDSSCRRIGIPRGEALLSPATLPAYLAQSATLAKEFAEDDIDLVVYGCTAAGLIAGPARDAKIAVDLAAVTGKRVVTTASAMGAVLNDLGARNIALVTPYLDAVNERLLAFLEPAGIHVEQLSSFQAQSVEALAAITPDEIAARAREVMRPGVDAIFIACSQLPTHAILLDLERELGVPVWSSIRATAWQVMHAAERA